MSDLQRFKDIMFEELDGAEVISAGPTRSGRHVQVRIRLKRYNRTGIITGRLNFFKKVPVPYFSLAHRLGKHYFFREVNLSYLEERDIHKGLEKELGILWKKIVEEVKKTVTKSDLQNKQFSYEGAKAKKSLKEWMTHAMENGVSDEEIKEIMNDCATEILLKS
jgi:hypothetical protein